MAPIPFLDSVYKSSLSGWVGCETRNFAPTGPNLFDRERNHGHCPWDRRIVKRKKK